MLNLVPTACQWSADRLFALQATVRGIRSSSCYCKPMAHIKPVDNSVAAAAPRQDVASSPPKKRRVEWQWECPACSNKHSTGPRLLHHMAKCCGDLLPSKYSLAHINTLVAQEQQCTKSAADADHSQQVGQQQQQEYTAQLQAQQAELQQHWHQHVDSSNSQYQQQPATHAADSHVRDLQAVMAAAVEQEHNLRMWALRLRFIDDSKQHIAAAAEAEDEADDEPSGQPAPLGTQPMGASALQAESSVNQQSSASEAASTAAAVAPGAGIPACEAQSGPNGPGGSSNSGSQSAAKKRGRARSNGRTPVRSVEQLMQEMKLPKARVLRLLERAPRSIKLVADKEPLQVVYEDAHFLAANKPPGLRSAPVHRFQGGSAVNRMIGYLGAEPYLLHRIDMDTSGVLLAAKDATTASLINAQFQSKQVSKAYLALCLGVPEQQTFTVDGPIAQHPSVHVARMVAADGLPAVTHVQVLSVSTSCPQDVSSRWGPAAAADPATHVKGVGCCLVCCRPVTGRTHQIRVHMAHAGHPLLADDVYGLQGPWMNRQALHAVSLTLQNPHSGNPLTFVAPPPDDFVAAAAVLGLAIPQPHQLAALSFGIENTSL